MKTISLLIGIILVLSTRVYGQASNLRFNELINFGNKIIVVDTLINSRLSDTNKFSKEKKDSIKTAMFGKDDTISNYKYFNYLYSIQRDSIIAHYDTLLRILAKKLSKPIPADEIGKIVKEYKDTETDKNNDLEKVEPLYVLAQQIGFTDRIQKSWWTEIPAYNSIQAQLFYDSQLTSDSQLLKNTNLVISPSNGKVSLMNEIYADYLGAVRLGIGILVSNNQKKNTEDSTTNVQKKDSTSTQDDAFQRLMGGGGNLVVNTSYPLFYMAIGRHAFMSKLELNPKFSLDVPSIGTESNKYALSGDLGLTESAYFQGMLNFVTVYTIWHFGKVGGNQLFFTNLLKDDHAWFWFNHATLGIALNSTFRIAWTVYFGEKFVNENIPSVVSFQIIPN